MTCTEVLLSDIYDTGHLTGARRVGVFDPGRIGAKSYLVLGSNYTVTWVHVDVQGQEPEGGLRTRVFGGPPTFVKTS